MSVSVRRVEQPVYDGLGNETHKDEFYELGAEIDGQFVAFVTKRAGYIDHKVEVAKANAPEQEQTQPSEQPASGEGTGGES